MKLFKTGDKVKAIKPITKESIFKGGVNEEMLSLLKAHKEFTVKKMSKIGCFTIEEDGEEWVWDAAYFKKVEKEKKEIKDVKVVMHKNETIVIVGDNVGKARKHPEDKDEDVFGIIVALLRAFNVNKGVIDNVVDALYDDAQIDLSKCSTEELLEEIKNRI